MAETASLNRLQQLDDLCRTVAEQSLRIEALERQVTALTARPAGAASADPPLPTAAAAAVTPSDPVRSPVAAGKRILNVAVVGARGHGSKHIENFLALTNCRITIICDVDSAVGAAAASVVESKTGVRPRVVQDLRDALSDPLLDAVSIATPHHWHALATIWALQAGKHVYIEKPLGQTFAEGQSILAAAAKYGRIVQFGTQLRSNRSLMAAAEYMGSGQLGDVDLVHCITYKPRPPLPAGSGLVIPKTVDHDLWCGPAPMDAQTRSRFHYDWHWFWEFGNGALGNNGIHRIDVARIGLHLQGLGNSVLSYGGRFGPPDGGETPNTQVVVHRFGKRWVVQEVRGLPTKAYRGVSNGILFFGTKGTVVYHKGFAALRDLKGVEVQRFPGQQENHYRNFVDAVLSGDSSQLTGDLFEGHISSGLCHLGNISHRLGKPASDASIAEAVNAQGAPSAVKSLLARMRTHLTDNQVLQPFLLGRLLQVDDTRNPVLADPEAAAMLTRRYRAPYAVPAPDAV